MTYFYQQQQQHHHRSYAYAYGQSQPQHFQQQQQHCESPLVQLSRFNRIELISCRYVLDCTVSAPLRWASERPRVRLIWVSVPLTFPSADSLPAAAALRFRKPAAPLSSPAAPVSAPVSSYTGLLIPLALLCQFAAIRSSSCARSVPQRQQRC